MDGYVFANKYSYNNSGPSTYGLVIQSLYNKGTTDDPKFEVKGAGGGEKHLVVVDSLESCCSHSTTFSCACIGVGQVGTGQEHTHREPTRLLRRRHYGRRQHPRIRLRFLLVGGKSSSVFKNACQVTRMLSPSYRGRDGGSVSVGRRETTTNWKVGPRIEQHLPNPPLVVHVATQAQLIA